MPATETIDFEHEFEELVRELRALPTAASDSVRERVRALGEPAPRRELPRLPSRRSLLVLAPVCVLALVSAAVVHGVLNSGAPKQQSFAQPGAVDLDERAAPALVPEHAGVAGSLLVPPTSGRYQDYEAWLTLRVKDADALTDRTNEAMRVVRSYGGYVASVEQSTIAGQPGRAELALRVPVSRVEAVLVRLSALGAVTERHLSI